MLTNWDPFADIHRFQEELNRRLGPSGSVAAFRPAVDIFEDKEAITLTAELPGLNPDNIHVSVEDHVLTLKGERKLEKEEKKDGYHRIERSYGAFTRSFSLPENIDTDHIHAEKKDGILTLKLLKKSKPEAKRIEIKGEG